MRPLVQAVCLTGITLLAGCSRDELVQVSGVVTWDGKPVPDGNIVFFSHDPHTPASAGKISDGKYSFQCTPGDKRVEIRSYRLREEKTPDGRAIGEMYIPKRYNAESVLKTNVTTDADNRFDFPLVP